MVVRLEGPNRDNCFGPGCFPAELTLKQATVGCHYQAEARTVRACFSPCCGMGWGLFGVGVGCGWQFEIQEAESCMKSSEMGYIGVPDLEVVAKGSGCRL